jgi:hypothetical protein
MNYNCLAVATELFPLLRGDRVLELGPHDGSWFTQHLLDYDARVTVIESAPDLAQTLKQNLPSVNTIVDDFHWAVRSDRVYDSVVLFGVLGHSHAPLGLLGDCIAYAQPKRLFIEAEPGALVRCVKSNYQYPGDPGVVIQLGWDIIDTALQSWDYRQIASYRIGPDYQGIPMDDFKREFEYRVYELHKT